MSDDIFASMVNLDASMASGRHTPSGTLCGKLRREGNIQIWVAESDARARHGGIVDRTLGALFLSAYLAGTEVFFVGQGPRERFNLTSDQLRRGLDRLERDGLVETMVSLRGRFRRVRLRGAEEA